MELVIPDIGLVFWMLVSFSIVLFILAKFAWKPILKSLKDREDSISDALKQAQTARDQMEKLQADNQIILDEARAERDNLLAEARDMKARIIGEAKDRAGVEAVTYMDETREAIRKEKGKAIEEIRKQVAILSVDIAEKLLMKELKTDKEQRDLIQEQLKDVKLN